MHRHLTTRIAAVLATLGFVVAASVGSPNSMATARTALLFNAHAEGLIVPKGGDARLGGGAETAVQESYDSRAYPSQFVLPAQRDGARQSHDQVGRNGSGKPSGWTEVGPITPVVPAEATYTGRATTASGRVSAIAVAPGCSASSCTLLVGAAGGGIWITDNALAAKPSWRTSSAGIASNAIGSIVFDPTDASGRTVYAGTGEPNGSSDSEAGVGLYRSTDGGRSWSLVTGSVAVSNERSIGGIAIDPTNAKHLFIGTNVARHGSSSVNGGRFTPPGAPKLGLYESKNGGASWTLVLSLPQDSVNPGSANGGDFFKGGVPDVVLDSHGNVYATTFGYGVWRRSTFDDNGSAFVQILQPNDPTDPFGERSAIALTVKNGHTRVYAGKGSAPATFVRTDNADVAAAAITWKELSDPTPGTKGFGSYNYCSDQCSYDMPVATPPGRPDEVWIGGQMQYDEIFTGAPPSNGRTVQRSANAGEMFTDMTNDTQNPPLGMHPDQHAIAFGPGGVAFLGSDGGVVRTSGSYADTSALCDDRGITGADLADCKNWLKAVPTLITSLNHGLATLQFQSVSVNSKDGRNDVLGGTQDNGTWAYNGRARSWFESVGGDGGQSGTDPANASKRMHTYYDAQIDVNFDGTAPLGWDWISDPFFRTKFGCGLGCAEPRSFYVPLINDPTTSGSWFVGLAHIWRTTDSGGDPAFLQQYCNEFTGAYGSRPKPCGDWQAIGQDLVAASGTKGGGYVVAIKRATSDNGTMWAATRRGRVFVTKNANATAASVNFTRIDTDAQPKRFVSGIAVDPADANHAFLSYSGYDAYTPTTAGHVFEVRYNPVSGTATWTDRSYDLGDQPITSIAYDAAGGDLYVATDWGVDLLQAGDRSWQPASTGLPQVAVYGLTYDAATRTLYAATHGRGIWRLDTSGSNGGNSGR